MGRREQGQESGRESAVPKIAGLTELDKRTVLEGGSTALQVYSAVATQGFRVIV